MKQMIQKVIRKSGWEIKKIQPVPKREMLLALEWQQSAGIEIATVLDVGASNGCWSRLCLSVYPAAKYLLYEANPVHFRELDALATECSSIHVDHRAVGPHTGLIRFDASDPWGGALDLEGLKPHSIEVPMVTIDVSIKEVGWDGPYLIKLDTHGFEKGILEGATETLRQTNALIIECYNFQITKESLRFWEFCHFMSELGFGPTRIIDVMNRKHDAALWQMDLLFLKKNWIGFEFVQYSK